MSDRESRKRHGLPVAILCLGVLIVMSLAAAPALADYEQASEHFGVSGEAEQLQEAQGMAVNTSGAGGVPAGSLYVVGGNNRVLRFTAGSEGEEPRFEEAWGWGVGSETEGYERCGPALVTEPAEHTYKSCKQANPNAPFGGEEVGHFESLEGVAVDQATGDVYVRDWNGVFGTGYRQHHLIEVFTATGVPVGEGFGDSAPSESIVERPEGLHRTYPVEGSIAVDEAGIVYLNDADYTNGVEHPEARVMCFKPEAGSDYKRYVYCGREHDIPGTYGDEASRIALVGNERLVVANSESIREFPLGVEDAMPVCSLAVSGQLKAMAANMATGEVFYYTFADRSVHRLATCDETTGKFVEVQKTKPSPVTKRVYALAVDPVLAWGTHPVGVLYVADAEEHLGPPVQLGIGDVFVPAERLAPQVSSESVAGVTTDSATFRARIDPRGFDTSYRFEYLSEAEYEANGDGFSGLFVPVRAPVGEGRVASGSVVTVTGAVSDLSADTAYRFRVVADSECEGTGQPACETVGGVASFATYPAVPSGTADDRVYELVSPVEKGGGEAFPADPGVGSCEGECKPPGGAAATTFPIQSAPNGGAVSYMGYRFSSEGAAVFNSYISSRTSSGWRTTAMSPALLASVNGGEHLTYSSLLSEGAIFQFTPALSAQAPVGYPNIYLQSAGDPGDLHPVLTSPPPHRAEGSFVLEYAGASPDYTSQFFAANDSLVAGVADPGQTGRDLYKLRDGQLSLVNYAPGDGSVLPAARFASASPDAHGVSWDGRTVFFEAGGQLYARIDGSRTLEVAAGEFLTAARDGSRVLLKDGRVFALNGAGDAYEQAADLSQGEGGFLGVLGQSEDLSRVYFAEKAGLAPEAQAGNCQEASSEPGKREEREGRIPPGYGCNLYLYEEGSATRFIASVAAFDGNVIGDGPKDWAVSPVSRTAQASPDGRYLAFASTRQLTGYDNVGPCGKVPLEHGATRTVDVPCTEVFLYDSVADKLACASCNPTGEAPLGPSTLRRIASERPWQPQPRYLTDSGRLFFDSQDRLSSNDANGRVEDVYEDEPSGVGSCERPAGCVLLISPGTGSVDSNFLATDEGGVENGESRQAGSDVFFTTREALVPQDTDELVDVYDAREHGGFSSETETQRSECQGEACQPTPSPLTETTPASSLFTGYGNIIQLKTAKCPSGTSLKSGTCTKAKTKKHNAGKRHKTNRDGSRKHRKQTRNTHSHRSTKK